ncbi:hypothetical protein SAMN04515672_0142 [Natronorubrum texcoconense]|uniref:Uncharacterized protein n=2 Tax=Natronorubrum texcoconense TaxID=1095776 RepID=A0A1G9H8G6_9EURY|nr:hypothetical protein SAMN04515672_0142 [Natronorubrum texcoconense]
MSAVLGGGAFLLVLLVLYFIALKTTSLGDDEHNTESTEDRLSMDGAERHRRIGFRRRVSRQTPMTKAFLASIIVLLCYLAIAVYQVASTGSPSEAAYTEYVEYGLFGLVCVAGGVWFKAKQNAKAGELQIMLEKGEGNRRQTVNFDRSQVRETADGTKLVAELKGHQAFGLFWRPLLVGDDPELRDADHRLPDDLVLYEVPDDESAVWDERTGEVTIRAKAKRTVDNPNRAADYEIVPSDRKSRSEIQDLENEKRELEEELRGEKVQNGILSEKLTEIENILTNEEDAGMRRLREAKDVLEPDRPATPYRQDEREDDRGTAAAQSD